MNGAMKWAWDASPEGLEIMAAIHKPPALAVKRVTGEAD
jgi:hypothetical protein